MTTPRLTNLLRAYDAWLEHRSVLWAAEDSEHASPSEWQYSDDEAVELLTAIVEELNGGAT